MDADPQVGPCCLLLCPKSPELRWRGPLRQGGCEARLGQEPGDWSLLNSCGVGTAQAQPRLSGLSSPARVSSRDSGGPEPPRADRLRLRKGPERSDLTSPAQEKCAAPASTAPFNETPVFPAGNDTSPESFLLHNALARKPKRIRTAFSPSQLLRLEHAFEKNHYVVGAERKQLAHSLSLTETQVSRAQARRPHPKSLDPCGWHTSAKLRESHRQRGQKLVRRPLLRMYTLQGARLP